MDLSQPVKLHLHDLDSHVAAAGSPGWFVQDPTSQARDNINDEFRLIQLITVLKNQISFVTKDFKSYHSGILQPSCIM